jgi:hypothetical protein
MACRVLPQQGAGFTVVDKLQLHFATDLPKLQCFSKMARRRLFLKAMQEWGL